MAGPVADLVVMVGPASDHDVPHEMLSIIRRFDASPVQAKQNPGALAPGFSSRMTIDISSASGAP
jgi:hypothetical protein